ncbi:MAG: Acetyltransferase (GNAT) family protein [Syntrophorhabdus sp. PtaU1.Bin002]|nr:MAG: Acetyltransferase (GNAT) family protein [Syntrophorhabdus sp. PtaU1.Bin002]
MILDDMAECNHEYHIDALSPAHIDKVVETHLRAFPNFFLSFLGPRFLREFYISFFLDPHGIGYTAAAPDGRILGVIVGPLDPQGYFKRLLKRRWWAFCLASISAVLRHPSCVPRLFRAVFYRGESPSGHTRALLSSIAVDPCRQRGGVGKELVMRWVEEARRRGAVGCYLTTDADDNDQVNAFYRGLHWHIESTYITPEGRRMNRYIYDF